MTKSKSYICPRHNMYKTFNDEDRLIDIVKCRVEFPPENIWQIKLILPTRLCAQLLFNLMFSKWACKSHKSLDSFVIKLWLCEEIFSCHSRWKLSQGGKWMVSPRATNRPVTKIGVIWQKSDFLAKNRDFGPKKSAHFWGLAMFWPRSEKVVQKKSVLCPKYHFG